MNEQSTKKMGRPSVFTDQLADELCAQLSEGRSLRSICETDEMPCKSTVFSWLRTNEEFRRQYEIAKQEAADSMADEILDIADDGTNDYMEKLTEGQAPSYAYNGEHVQRSRLRVDSRKWIASKLKPKKYGDRVAQEISGPDGGPIDHKWTVEHIEPRLPDEDAMGTDEQ